MGWRRRLVGIGIALASAGAWLVVGGQSESHAQSSPLCTLENLTAGVVLPCTMVQMVGTASGEDFIIVENSASGTKAIVALRPPPSDAGASPESHA